MTGTALSTCAFLAATALLALQTSYSDFGTKATVFVTVFAELGPVLFMCFILQALFIRSSRKSIFDREALLLSLFFIGQLGLSVVIFNQTALTDLQEVTIDFVRSIFRSVIILLFMGWIYWEARKRVKEHPNFLLNFIQIFCGFCVIQSLAWICFLATDFSNDFELVEQFGGWLSLDMINRVIRTGIFCLVQVLICIYWSQHYSQSAIQDHQKQERIQE